MLTLIEKVLILKATATFAGVRDEVLGEIARRADEVNLVAGERLFAEGDVGSCLFVVVRGRLAEAPQGGAVACLGERQVIGELAALDPESRPSTVTAVEPSALLRISNNDLNLLMSADVEVARSFITLLCRRLRANTNQEK